MFATAGRRTITNSANQVRGASAQRCSYLLSSPHMSCLSITNPPNMFECVPVLEERLEPDALGGLCAPQQLGQHAGRVREQNQTRIMISATQSRGTFTQRRSYLSSLHISCLSMTKPLNMNLCEPLLEERLQLDTLSVER